MLNSESNRLEEENNNEEKPKIDESNISQIKNERNRRLCSLASPRKTKMINTVKENEDLSKKSKEIEELNEMNDDIQMSPSKITLINLFLNFILILSLLIEYRISDVSLIYQTFDRVYTSRPVAYDEKTQNYLFLNTILSNQEQLQNLFIKTRLLNYIYNSDNENLDKSMFIAPNPYAPPPIVLDALSKEDKQSNYFLSKNLFLGMMIEFKQILDPDLINESNSKFYKNLIQEKKSLLNYDDGSIHGDNDTCINKTNNESINFNEFKEKIDEDNILYFPGFFEKCDAYLLLNTSSNYFSETLGGLTIRLFYSNIVLNIIFEYDIIMTRDYQEGFFIKFNEKKKNYYFYIVPFGLETEIYSSLNIDDNSVNSGVKSTFIKSIYYIYLCFIILNLIKMIVKYIFEIISYFQGKSVQILKYNKDHNLS